MCRVAVPDTVRGNSSQQPDWSFNGAYNAKNERANPVSIQQMLKTSAAVADFVPDFFAPPAVDEQSLVQQQEQSDVPQQESSLEQSDMLECLDAFSDPLPSASSAVAVVDEFAPSDVSIISGPRRTFSAFMEECEYSAKLDNPNEVKTEMKTEIDYYSLGFDNDTMFDFGIPDEESLGKIESDNAPLGVKREKNSCPSTPESSYESDGASYSQNQIFNAQVVPPPKPMDMREQVGIILALPGDGDVIYRTDLAAPNAANEHGVKRSRFKGVRWYRRTGRWVVQLRDAGRRKHLGYFTDEILAGRAYAKAMKELNLSRGDDVEA